MEFNGPLQMGHLDGKEGGWCTMRIGAYNQINQLYGKQSVKKKQDSSTISATSTRDQVSFSTTGKDIQITKAALSSIPDIREDKVNAIKERIAAGTYNVSAESFADKLIAVFDEKSF